MESLWDSSSAHARRRAWARVGAVDEASTAAREGACAPRDQPKNHADGRRGRFVRFHCPLRFSGRINRRAGRKQEALTRKTKLAPEIRNRLTTNHTKPHKNRSGAGKGSRIQNCTHLGWRRGWPFRRASGPTRRAGRQCHPFQFRISGPSRNDSVKKNFNHRWTQINTDEEMSERRSGPDFRRSLNDALYVVLEYHVFHLCPSVSICG